MSEYFKMQGYHVDCAQRKAEAEDLLANAGYSVIIEDLRLGGMHNVEGLEIVEHVRKNHPETRIVVLTAYGSSEMESEAMKRGADAFLRKPKLLSDVAQVVFGLLSSQTLNSSVA